MKILHLGDSHLGQHLTTWGHDTGWHRSQDHLHALERGCTAALSEGADVVVHAGDLFDSRRPAPKVVQSAEELLYSLAEAVPVVVIRGNHDPPSFKRLFRLPPPALHLVDEPTRLRIGAFTLGALPWCRRPNLWLEALPKAVGPGVDALLAHQAFHGSRVPGFRFRVGKPPETIGPDHLLPGVPLVMAGHIHAHQAFNLGAAQIVHAGSTERTAFVEWRQQKGWVWWTLEREVSWRFCPAPARPMHSVRDEHDLAGVGTRELVLIREGPAMGDLFLRALDRGAWVVGRRPGEPRSSREVRDSQPQQTRLFPPPGEG